MDTAPSIQISKTDAAVRQLNTAITLWFEGGDPVSIHTLAASAHQVIADIVRAKKGPDLLFDSLVFKDEFRKEANDFLRAPQNFFKHAGSNADAKIEFRPMLSELFFMMTIAGLEFLQIPHDAIRAAYIHWFGFTNPKILTAKGKKQYASLPDPLKHKIQNLSKAEFFKIYLMADAAKSKVKGGAGETT